CQSFLCVLSCLLQHLVLRHSLPLVTHFVFNPPATTEIYTLSLHDALPILIYLLEREPSMRGALETVMRDRSFKEIPRETLLHMRSEEHTSELQSRRDLVCRLLLEKKNNLAAGNTRR